MKKYKCNGNTVFLLCILKKKRAIQNKKTCIFVFSCPKIREA